MQRLREDVSMLISTRNMHQCDETSLYLITDGVAVNLHVFSPFMEDRVGSNVHRRLVVTEKLCFGGDLNLQTGEKLLKPQKFTSRVCHATIFSFSAASTNHILLI